MRKIIFCLGFALKITTTYGISVSNGSVDQKQESYITASLIGQTGNFLFQIATASAVAWENGVEAYFPDLLSKPTLYQHLFSRCKTTPPSSEISVDRTEGFPIVFEPKMRMCGYFQEERYFAPYRDKLLELFAPTERDMKHIRKKYGWLIDKPNTVGIQIRYYRHEVVDGYPQYGLRYLEKAMALFPKDSLFVISSNNLEYARKHIPSWAENIVFLEGQPDYIDFYILSLCQDNIITNSSFGWWSAWLNRNSNKKVVCPFIWTGMSSDEIFPKDWIRVEAEAEDL